MRAASKAKHFRRVNPRKSKKPAPAAKTKQQAITIRSAPIQPWVLNSEEVTILKNAICKGATDQEMTHCLTVARRYHLDPFQQQIWFVKRWDSEAIQTDGKRGGYVWTPQVAMNGLLHIAARDHKDFGTYSEPEFGPMIQVTFQKNGQGSVQKLTVPEWARIEAHKKGCEQPTVARVWWQEIYKNIDYAPMVRQMPRLMLGKCAKAQATRTAYPATGGLLITEECQGPQFTQFTPEGRIISREDREKAIDVKTSSEEAYLKREAEQIAKLPAEAQERIKRQRERSAAVESEMIPCIFYKEHGSGFVVAGADKLLHDNRELFVPLFNKEKQHIFATPEQLGKLISELERRKVPIKALDRQPGE